MEYANTQKTMITDDQYITPDRRHSALIMVGVQHDFTLVSAAAEVPGTLRSLPHIRRLVQRYREVGYYTKIPLAVLPPDVLNLHVIQGTVQLKKNAHKSYRYIHRPVRTFAFLYVNICYTFYLPFWYL